MIRGLVRMLWTSSPAMIAAAARRRLRRSDVPPDAYEQWLFDEFYAFVLEQYPEGALPRTQFDALISRYGDPEWLRATNRYVGDLWYLFAPDFRSRLDDYYRYYDLQLTLTLLTYSRNRSSLRANYGRAYQLALQQFSRVSILEFGAGIPHGFLQMVFERGASFCRSFTTVDIEGTPARFVQWFCLRHGVEHRWVRAIAGETPCLDGLGPYDFVFAKDVFEHLHAPDAALQALLATAAPVALLALDLDDKGAVEYQHVSPTLQHLRGAVEQARFRLLERAGNMSIFLRNG